MSLESFLDAIRERESGGDYQIVNAWGFMGAYQFGEAALVDLGFVNLDDDAFNNDFSGGFTGRLGVNSRTDFLNSPDAQDAAAVDWFHLLWTYIVRYELDPYTYQTLNGYELTPSGMLAASHLLGVTALRDFIHSGGTVIGQDQLSTKLTDYLQEFAWFDLGDEFQPSTVDDTPVGDGGGNDTVPADQGAEPLACGTNHDGLDAAPGSQKPLAMAGYEMMQADAGGDTFVFDTADASDTILDFETGTDVLQLDEDLWGGGLTAEQVVNIYGSVGDEGVTLTFGPDQTVLLVSVESLDHLADDILLV